MKHLGSFSLPHGQTLVGELTISDKQTTLVVHSGEAIPELPPKAVISGHAYSGKALTLIDCISYSAKSETAHNPGGDVHRHQQSAYVGHVVIGPRHIDPNATIITRIEFSVTDLNVVFYDYKAFGVIIPPRNLIDAVLQQRKRQEPIESGDEALIAYYSGKRIVIAIPTVIGMITVEHRAAFGSGSRKGVHIKDHLTLCVAPDSEISFHDVLECVSDLVAFLSVAAGRRQRIHRVRIFTDQGAHPIRETFAVNSSIRWNVEHTGRGMKPEWRDIPLDPINRQAEFSAVLANWVKSRHERRMARARYLDGLKKGNRYGYDRMVAAANMFDLLPKDAVPAEATIDPDLKRTRDECVVQLKKLPKSIDRNSAISSLARIGKPSLPKKVEHRVNIINGQIGAHFPDLGLFAKYAVRCRNAFVHGNADEFDLERLERFVPFLTETLEFVFATSDFVDLGWDANVWASRPYTGKHSFTRYRWIYPQIAPQLKAAIKESQSP
jgi:ApeA N-terminal domain 1/Apea-like HEPN